MVFSTASVWHFIVFSVLLGPLANAEVVGSFDGRTNSPGFINIEHPELHSARGAVFFPLSFTVERRTLAEALVRTLKDIGGKEWIPAALDPQGRIRESTMQFYKNKISQTEDFLKPENGSSEAIRVEWLKSQWRKAFAAAKDLNARGFLLNSNAAVQSETAKPFVDSFYQMLLGIESVWTTISAAEKNETLEIATGLHFRTLLRISDDRPEAQNLKSPEGKLEPTESLVQRGLELWKLDPVDSTLWRKPTWDISQFDLRNYSRLTEKNRGSEMVNPDSVISVTYKEKKFGGLSPKFQAVYVNQKGKSEDYKVKFEILQARHEKNPITGVKKVFGSGAEAQSEAVVNGVIAAIGYTAQPTYYHRAVRVYFNIKGSKNPAITWQQVNQERINMIEDIRKSNESSSLVWPKSLHQIFAQNLLEKDSDGRWYLKVPEVALEQSSKKSEDIELGGWDKAALGRKMMREHRAALIIHALIQDSDIKPTNATARLVREKGGGDFKLVYALSDLGFAFGGLFTKNALNAYDWNMVDWSRSKFQGEGKRDIVPTYRSYHEVQLFNSVTVNDARWIL
ncbi:MAG: hypothetical protein K2X47_12280, partial [Bdellovibrionales bacterium]|nr:hypothetical protein [Bdellovibrionales bacterium]